MQHCYTIHACLLLLAVGTFNYLPKTRTYTGAIFFFCMQHCFIIHACLLLLAVGIFSYLPKTKYIQEQYFFPSVCNIVILSMLVYYYQLLILSVTYQKPEHIQEQYFFLYAALFYYPCLFTTTSCQPTERMVLNLVSP